MIRPALAALLSATMLAAFPAYATVTVSKPTSFLNSDPNTAGSVVRFDPYTGPAATSVSLTLQGFFSQDFTRLEPDQRGIPATLTFDPNGFIDAGRVFSRFVLPSFTVPVRMAPDGTFSAHDEYNVNQTVAVNLSEAIAGLEVEYGIYTAANEIRSDTPSQRRFTGQITLSFTEAAQSVPEPASFALLGAGLLAVWGRRRIC